MAVSYSSVVKNTSLRSNCTGFYARNLWCSLIIFPILSESCMSLIITRIEFGIKYLVMSELGSVKFLPTLLLSML